MYAEVLREAVPFGKTIRIDEAKRIDYKILYADSDVYMRLEHFAKKAKVETDMTDHLVSNINDEDFATPCFCSFTAFVRLTHED